MMHFRMPVIAVLMLLAAALPAFAQPYVRESTPRADVETMPSVFYAIDKGATLYSATDSTREYLHLRFREPLYVTQFGVRWSHVRTMDGANGLVRTTQISDVWIRVSKKEQTLYLYRGSRLMARYPTDLGYNFFADKERQGSAAEPDHWRTPEGEFFVVSKNPKSEYYRALVLNYPNGEDAQRGRDRGLISQAEFDAIVRAERFFEKPPMDTDLGGYIEIHGNGTGQRSNWTHGCIAVQNDDMDRLWDLVVVGTPVLIDS